MKERVLNCSQVRQALAAAVATDSLKSLPLLMLGSMGARGGAAAAATVLSGSTGHGCCIQGSVAGRESRRTPHCNRKLPLLGCHHPVPSRGLTVLFTPTRTQCATQERAADNCKSTIPSPSPCPDAQAVTTVTRWLAGSSSPGGQGDGGMKGQPRTGHSIAGIETSYLSQE